VGESVAFARNFSLEATRPDAAEIAALAAILPPATPVYLTAVPSIDTRELVTAAAGLREAGLEPVAHIAARRLAGAGQLSELLAGLRGEADMHRLLVIGGDVDSAGAFADALAVIQKGRLREAGIEEIGIGGYPEGHPRIAQGVLEAALDQKIAAARAAGLRVFIVSQFSFSPERILAWLRQLRACGIAVPVKVGLAGPASVAALLRYAKRCGVSASLRGLMSGTAAGLIGHAGPDRIMETLAVVGDLGTAPHYFSFGGPVETARYACEAAAGRIAAGHAMARFNSN
jgi:methylenetetrahydrofolate reductase (NADPH)